MQDLLFNLRMRPQPNETTCGPTCLHGIYQLYGDDVDHNQLIQEIPVTKGGGTLGVCLGLHALRRGYDVTIYTHNLHVFDPSWFYLNREKMGEKLLAQAAAKPDDTKTVEASQFYADFLKLNGNILFKDLNPSFLHNLLLQNGPLICGLSATYLYKINREINETGEYDDVKGYPQGHFVVLSGILGNLSEVEVTDPLQPNPMTSKQKYRVGTQHFLNSLLIGVITYDANLVVIRRPKGNK